MKHIQIQIAATFTAEPVGKPIEFLLGLVQKPAEIAFAPFNQVFQELLTPTSSFAQNTGGVNILLIRLEDLASGVNQAEALARNADELVAALQAAVQRYQVPILLVFCPASAGALRDSGGCALLAQIEARLNPALQQLKGVHFVTSEQLGDLCPVAEYDNARGNRLGAVPYTPRFFAILGQLLARRIYRLTTPPHKVVVLDCDQTLWKGIVGEDGPQGIEIDPPRRFLQQFMVDQSLAGMVLCLCSKNNEAEVWEVFDQRSDMPLRREHIVAWRINWERKSENIKALASELRLGLDSFIFVDDDRVVCAEVEANCPEVLTIRLPEEAGQIQDFFCNHWAFDHLSVTTEDRQRTEMYRQNVERTQLLENSSSLEDFLQSLDLKCEITPIAPEQMARVAQLTQRTNQFNANGLRRNEAELRHLLDQGAQCLVVNVEDRFGDYGLVGAMIYIALERDLDVDTFLLSCRALGRGVEHRMLATLGRHATEAGLESVAVQFAPTKKNQPARDFFEKTGAAYKESNGAEFVFRYPSKAALELTYIPDLGSDPGGASAFDAQRPSATKPLDSGSGLTTANPGLYQIATELHLPEVLLSRLEPVKTQRPNLAAAYSAPTTDLESRLVEIWESVLNVCPIGVMDDYFELGGDSLMAVCLFVEIEEKFGRQVPLATLFEAPTISKLAQRLTGIEQKQQWRHLVPIQTEGGRPPLFCMHAAGGNVFFYRDLSRHLGPGQPVYGLQAREMPETGRYLDKVEDMASQYLKEIRNLQAEGPYYLCGSSFGGLLAFEIAQQLRAHQEKVALVALFDTYGPGYPKPLPDSSRPARNVTRLTERFQSFRELLGEMNSLERKTYIKGKARKVVTKIKRKWLWKKNEFQIKYSQALGLELPKDMQRNHKAIQQALENYKPRAYDGKLSLFRAATQPTGITPDPFLGWKCLSLQNIEVFESPGTHGAMTVDPYAERLAQNLVSLLAKSDLHGDGPMPSAISPGTVAEMQLA